MSILSHRGAADSGNFYIWQLVDCYNFQKNLGALEYTFAFHPLTRVSLSEKCFSGKLMSVGYDFRPYVVGKKHHPLKAVYFLNVYLPVVQTG